MLRMAGLILGAALAACSPPQEKAAEAPAAEAPRADPSETVRALYEPSASPEFRDRAPWSADLWAQLDAMTARSRELGEPILNFDPVTDAQDGEPANLTVATDAVSENSHAVVRANFDLGSETREIVYDLVWEGGEWRVDNIRTAQWDLRQIAAGP